jgi:hypothetical protein
MVECLPGCSQKLTQLYAFGHKEPGLLHPLPLHSQSLVQCYTSFCNNGNSLYTCSIQYSSMWCWALDI